MWLACLWRPITDFWLVWKRIAFEYDDIIEPVTEDTACTQPCHAPPDNHGGIAETTPGSLLV